MREHLYKAKRINWKELPKEEWWVEGFYAQLPKASLGATIVADGDLCAEDVADYIIVNRFKQHSNFSNAYPLEIVECEMYEIDPDTICEYTGLTDKNKAKIWENDVVKMKDKNICGIIEIGKYSDSDYGDSNFGCYIKWNEKEEIPWKQNICPWIEDDSIEICGNVFDNPELLKGDEAE